MVEFLQGLVAVAADQEQKYQNFAARVKSVNKEMQDENVTNSLIFDSFSTEISKLDKKRSLRYTGLWSEFQKTMLNSSRLLGSSREKLKTRIASLSVREARDYVSVLAELNNAENLTSQWYNTSVDHDDLQEQRLKLAFERFQGVLETDMRSLETDDTQAEDRVQALLEEGARAMRSVKTAVGASLAAARAAAYALHRRTIEGLGPLRQSLSSVGSEEDEVATNIEGNRIYLEDRLKPVEVDMAALDNETRLQAAAAELDLSRLINRTDAISRDLEARYARSISVACARLLRRPP